MQDEEDMFYTGMQLVMLRGEKSRMQGFRAGWSAGTVGPDNATKDVGH